MPSQQFFIPDLPAATTPNFNNITEMLKSIGSLPKLTETLVPQVNQLFGEQGQFLMPQINAIREQGSSMVANAQADAGARGLRGSDIEAAGMLGARQGALAQESQLRGQFGLAQTNAMTEILTRAMSGDLEAATQLRALLSQAMGEELGAQRDMEMFYKQLQENIAMASRANKNALWGAAIGAGGSIIGGALSGGVGKGGGGGGGNSIGGGRK